MRSQDTETEHQVRAFSSWGNPSAPPYQSNEDRYNTIMRVRITPNDQRTIKTGRQNQEYKNKIYYGKRNQNEMKSHQRALLQNVQNEYSACSIPQRAINAAILLAEQYYLFHLYVMEYNRNYPATTIVPYIFLFKNNRTIKNNQERANQYTDLFGWHKNPATTRRKDIRTPTIKWMHLMYQIGATLL